LANPWILAFYVIAIDRDLLALCLRRVAVCGQVGHYSGVTARKRFGYVCAVLGVVLAVGGLASIWAFVRG